MSGSGDSQEAVAAPAPFPEIGIDSALNSQCRLESTSSHTSDEAQKEVLASPTINFIQLCRVCRRGLSDWSRPAFWKVVMGFYTTSQIRWEKIESSSEKDYADILSGSCQLDEGGNPVLNNPVGVSIDADIPRTMPTLHFFLDSDPTTLSSTSRRTASTFSHTQRSLRRITCTAVTVNKGFGYVQGMIQLVAHLLIAFCEGKKENLTRRVEADVFFCFQTLLGYLGDDFCRTLDDSKESGVISTIRHFDNLLQLLDLELYDHLQTLGIFSEHYALRWLMLLFTQEFNIADSLRVWDFLLSFGDQLRNAALYVAAAMCFYLRDELLSKDCLSDAIPLLLDYPPCDTNDFLRVAMRWIVTYDFAVIAKVKLATREELIALRQEHGLQPKDGIGAKVQNMIFSLFR